MFQTRLIREDDALLCFATLSFLTRKYGAAARPIVPSPLHKSRGLETLFHAEDDPRKVYDWAQDAYATVTDAMQVAPEAHRLVASVEAVPARPGLLTYDPRRAGERGQFTARLILELCERKLEGFDPGFVPSPFQAGVILLSAAAYFRQGFVLTHLPEAVADVLSGTGASQRFIVNTLVFAQCAALTVLRQTPEQIVATYGPVIDAGVRKKVRHACRQIAPFEPEVKLLRVMGEPQSRTHRPLARGSIRAGIGTQPQRISWT